jgi:hypothetical protein
MKFLHPQLINCKASKVTDWPLLVVDIGDSFCKGIKISKCDGDSPLFDRDP